MTDDAEKMAQALATMMQHVDAAHLILDGAERVIDARAMASVYIARASKILATLRVRGITSRDEIELLAEQLVLQAMRDENAGIARNPQGQELLTPADKAKVN